MRKLLVGALVGALLYAFTGATPASATSRTETVTWSFFGEHDVSCDIRVVSSRTVEGSGAHLKTHLFVQTAIQSTSDDDCFAYEQDLAANLTYRRKVEADPETIVMHSFGHSPTVTIDVTVNGKVAQASASHVAQFDCDDVHPCTFTFGTSPK